MIDRISIDSDVDILNFSFKTYFPQALNTLVKCCCNVEPWVARMMFSRHIFTKSIRHHKRCFSSTTARHADFTHAVIGAGAVGLAIARRLQQIDGASVVLIEKHDMVGSETSSRNSEVGIINPFPRMIAKAIPRSFMPASTMAKTA